MMMAMEAELPGHPDVVVVGAGRVGLPLALSFAAGDLQTVVVDTDESRCRQINDGVAPFVEPGMPELLSRRLVLATNDFSVIDGAGAVVISVGTPLRANMEPDLAFLKSAVETVSLQLRRGQLVVLRSTVPPDTTPLVASWIEEVTSLRVGVDIWLAFCPERLAEGAALKELKELPQIVGADDPGSVERASDLFSTIAPSVIPTSSKNAELAKLLANASRYAEFAVANHLAFAVEEFGADYHEVREIATQGYPRGIGRRPGFTAGTCLRKDFGMLSEFSFGPDILTDAWRVNESVPMRLISGVKARRDVAGANVCILGMSFKADVDDLRDSLSVKLYRQLLRERPGRIAVSDPMLGDVVDIDGVGTTKNLSFDEATRGADIVFIATNHSEYYPLAGSRVSTTGSVLFVDLWNVSGAGSVYFWGDVVGAPDDH